MEPDEPAAWAPPDPGDDEPWRSMVLVPFPWDRQAGAPVDGLTNVSTGVAVTSTQIGTDWAPPEPWAPPMSAPVGADPTRRVTVADEPPPTPLGSGSATLVADGVSCWFGERKVLEDVNLTMPPSQITALIGPSGCGKSTFLRSLNRLHELIPGAAIGGSVKLNGADIYAASMSPTQTRAQIGMVFQRANPFPAMSIRDNVLAGLSLTGRRARGAGDLVEECLTRAGLWKETKGRLHTSGASLSGGQQQRLCIARALAVRPDVLLMDEPCSALDPISTGLIEETMLSIKHDVTIVIVTHNMQQAGRVSDQCALFLVEEENQPGRVIESGPTQVMFSSPSDSRTLDYISGRFG